MIASYLAATTVVPQSSNNPVALRSVSLQWAIVFRLLRQSRCLHIQNQTNTEQLQIMEALGGDKRWIDRFLGQHASILYYWALVVVFFFSPKWSYKFSEMLESAPSTSAEGCVFCLPVLRC